MGTECILSAHPKNTWLNCVVLWLENPFLNISSKIRTVPMSFSANVSVLSIPFLNWLTSCTLFSSQFNWSKSQHSSEIELSLLKKIVESLLLRICRNNAMGAFHFNSLTCFLVFFFSFVISSVLPFFDSYIYYAIWCIGHFDRHSTSSIERIK